ncbi:MAG TPA: acyloxyacyl hydrolase [Chthoniobacterales bacterium]|jgi:opacity protein-like surface antigen|nr:acyloxyacyl hydrolase [Chthoniobacterales bacterium]
MTKLLPAFVALLISTTAGFGGVEEPVASTLARETESNFSRGAKEFQNVSGAFFFFDTTQNNRPAIDFALDSLRLGIMLNDPWQAGPLSGNFELLGEIFGGGIFNGPGDVMAGATLVMRYNFVQPHARLVPYLQIGAGGVYTNIGEEESRGLISLPVEFNLQGIVGARVMLNDRWSLVLEGAYRHISNAEIKKPNYGIDSGGGNVGLGFFF